MKKILISLMMIILPLTLLSQFNIGLEISNYSFKKYNSNVVAISSKYIFDNNIYPKLKLQKFMYPLYQEKENTYNVEIGYGIFNKTMNGNIIFLDINTSFDIMNFNYYDFNFEVTYKNKIGIYIFFKSGIYNNKKWNYYNLLSVGLGYNFVNN